MRNIARLAVAFACLMLSSASLKAQGTIAQNTSPQPGAEVFASDCASCHGASAATIATKKMKLTPAGDAQLKSGRALSIFLSAHQVYDEQDRLDLEAYFKALLTPKPR